MRGEVEEGENENECERDRELEKEAEGEVGSVVRAGKFGGATVGAIAGVFGVGVQEGAELGVEGGAAPVAEAGGIRRFAFAVVATFHGSREYRERTS